MSVSSPAGMPRQPEAVYAVAFACVVSFVGIGGAPDVVDSELRARA